MVSPKGARQADARSPVRGCRVGSNSTSQVPQVWHTGDRLSPRHRPRRLRLQAQKGDNPSDKAVEISPPNGQRPIADNSSPLQSWCSRSCPVFDQSKIAAKHGDTPQQDSSPNDIDMQLASLQNRAQAAAMRVAHVVAKSHAALGTHAKLPKRRARSTLGLHTPLLQVPEHRSMEFMLGITFLVPHGNDPTELMNTLSLVFPMVKEEHYMPNLISPTALVPQGYHNMALVSFQTMGPVDALKKAQCHSKNNLQDALNPTGLPETSDVFCSQSAAIVYVVRPFESEEEAEQQLGPICSIEACCRSMFTSLQPKRYVAVMHSSSEPYSLLKQGVRDPVGDDILSRLRSRAVASMPCTAIAERDLKSHQALITQVVDDLTAPTKVHAAHLI